MNKGDMFFVLTAAERMLMEDTKMFDDPNIWHSLDVDYEPPHVERLWLPFEKDYRLYLHIIHPCEEALFHPHPWPSAVKVLSCGYGSIATYEMGIGSSSTNEPPREIMTQWLSPGACYEMIDPDGWHYVRPRMVPSMSIMVTGPKWNRWSPGPLDRTLMPLSAANHIKQLAAFRALYHR